MPHLDLDINSSALAAKPTRYRFFVVAILMIIIFIAFFDRVNISVLIANDAFLNDLGIKGQPMKIGLLMSSFLFSYGVANVFLSPLGDYFGPRKMSLLAISLWVVSTFIGGISGSFIMLIAARILLGIGEGTQYPSQSMFVKNWFPPHERGRANAAWLIGQSLAPATAMPFFTWIIGSMGWRPSFFVCSVLGLIPIYLLWFHLTDKPREHKNVNLLETEYIEAGLNGEVVQTGIKSTLWENMKTFIYSYRFWLLVIWTCAMSIITWGLVTWLPSYLKVARGFSWTQMGFLASLPFLIAVAAKAAGGWLADKTGKNAPFCAIAMLVTAVGVFFGAVSTNNVVSALLIALGQGALSIGLPSSWALVQSFAPGKGMSTAAGIMNGIAIAIGSLSPVIIGYCISLTGGYLGGLLFLVVTALVGLFASLVLVYKKY